MGQDLQEITYVQFEQFAPVDTWAEVASVFVSIFTAPPYNEPPEALRSIDQWGPEKLGSPGGRLVVASLDGEIIGFALSQRLDQDTSWQQRLNAMVPALDKTVTPSTTVIVQELAVDERFRGRGVAKACIRALLSDRSEHDVVLGVFDKATQARQMYRLWGFMELGASPLYGNTVTLHALHKKLPLFF